MNKNKTLFFSNQWLNFSKFIYDVFSKTLLIAAFITLIYFLFKGYWIEVGLLLLFSILIAPIIEFLLEEIFRVTFFTKKERVLMTNFSKDNNLNVDSVMSLYASGAKDDMKTFSEKTQLFKMLSPEKKGLSAVFGIAPTMLISLFAYAGLLSYFSTGNIYSGIDINYLNYASILILYLAVDVRILLVEIYFSRQLSVTPYEQFILPFKIITILLLCLFLFLNINLSYTLIFSVGLPLIFIFSIIMFYGIAKKKDL